MRKPVRIEPAQAPLQPAYYDAPDAVAPAAPTVFRRSRNSESTAPEPPAIREETPEARPSQPQRARPETATRAADGGGEEADEAAAGPQGARAAALSPARRVQTEGAPPVAPRNRNRGCRESNAGSRARASKGTVVLAIGLPGSGKSSWFKRHNITPLSSDMLRALLFDDPTEQRFQDLIFSNLRSMLKARLIARRPLNYVDATNLTPHERQSWIKLGQDYGYEVQAVFFDVPLEVCLERNHKRERTVADDVMRRMSAKLKAPTFEEGFSKITVVRVKRKE